jgi:hypothetical protein
MQDRFELEQICDERMTDYYPVLLRAVAALEANTFEGRRTIYNHARTALIDQLDKRPFIKKDFDRERLMLEHAISRVEADTANKQVVVAPSEPAEPAVTYEEKKSFFARFYAAVGRLLPIPPLGR